LNGRRTTMPWKAVHKNSRMVKSDRSMVLLLGGSIYDEDNGTIRIANRRRRIGKHNSMKYDVHREEHLWQQDFRAVCAFFERAHVNIWRSIPTRLHSDRNQAWQVINEFFQHGNNDKNKMERRTFVLYWCGHGMPNTGDWTFSVGGDITCRDIMSAWHSHHTNDVDRLLIIADTCYSGAWIEQIRMEQIPHVAYQAASRADECAYVVNDGNIPRSLLMRKYIIEQNYSIGWYPWTCSKQHPMHVIDPNNDDITEVGNDLGDGQRRISVHIGSLAFFTIDWHWTSNGKINSKQCHKELKQLADYGAYIENI
jgi:hypothetical protein